MTYTLENLKQDKALQARAKTALPNGMYGHMNTALMAAAPNYPQYISRADGGRIWDIDGNEYIDFMCSFGPVLLGHHHPKVDEAAKRQMALGDCVTGTSPFIVELAETINAKCAHADWSLFCKNGTDATTIGQMIARAHTGRKTIAIAKGTYHGSAPWNSISSVGVTAEERANVVMFNYNDIASLKAAALEAGDDLAGVMVTPHRHEVYAPQELVDPAFANAVRALCDQSGAALILDEVRTSFRFNLDCSWQTLGVQPDITAMGKSLANGHCLSAVTGGNAFRGAASDIFVTGSFWFSAVPFAAALATIEAIEREDALQRIQRAGDKLCKGLVEQANAYNIAMTWSGPSQMPLFLFDNDNESYDMGMLFCNEAIKRGVYLHPVHNMFICAAHEKDIDDALSRTEGAFKALRQHFGDG